MSTNLILQLRKNEWIHGVGDSHDTNLLFAVSIRGVILDHRVPWFCYIVREIIIPHWEHSGATCYGDFTPDRVQWWRIRDLHVYGNASPYYVHIRINAFINRYSCRVRKVFSIHLCAVVVEQLPCRRPQRRGRRSRSNRAHATSVYGSGSRVTWKVRKNVVYSIPTTLQTCSTPCESRLNPLTACLATAASGCRGVLDLRKEWNLMHAATCNTWNELTPRALYAGKTWPITILFFLDSFIAGWRRFKFNSWWNFLRL